VKTVLGKLDTMRRGKERGHNVTNDIKWTSGRFAGRVEKIFKNVPMWLEGFNPVFRRVVKDYICEKTWRSRVG